MPAKRPNDAQARAFCRAVAAETAATLPGSWRTTAIAGGKKSDSQRKSGEGSVAVMLMPEVKVDGLLMVRGVRPGIDGAYRVSSVSHRLDRTSGGVTTIELKQPSRGTGAKGDTRKTGLEEEVRWYGIANAPGNQGPGGSGQG